MRRRAAEGEGHVFLVYFLTAHRRPAVILEFKTADDVRALLTKLGIVGFVQDRAVDEAGKFSLTLVRGVELPQEFVDEHGL